MTRQEHPFAEYIRILGKGKKGSRPLTREEAYQAMRMILAGEVLPVQLGAFLMLMRVKEETPEELAGFIQAARETFSPFGEPSCPADLDWSSYAGKRRHLPWFLLSALLLAENGIKVFMHGAGGHTAGRIYTHDALKYLGIEHAASLQEARQQLEEQSFSYLPLEYFCPKLHEIIELRPIMGLRSPVHTLARMLNPFNAKHSIQAIFHPGYRPVHQEAALLLNDLHVAVFKGESGEVERNPDADCLVQSVKHGELYDEQWPRIFERRHVKSETLDPKQLAAVWQGDIEDEYGEAAVIGTAAIALKLIGKADSQDCAMNMAEDFWRGRKLFE
ncbi:glycosyl transferase family protein [Methylotuvimicrobium sp.]|jgi:anthranilate phosphoribosyltransferase|uniref:glycosyl transferase family protein n=1 Tax=Methylotuvimicrobium sp. TaxID=2822413 RepID=UPI003D64CCF7